VAPPGAVASRVPPAAATFDQLRERAEQALRERRLYAPAGDNAIEYFLEARERQPDDLRSRAALIELQPYLLIGLEQLLESGQESEAQRLLRLLARADAQAPALPRLQAVLDRVQQENKARQAALAAEARALPAPLPQVPVAAGVAPPSAAASIATTLPAPIPEPAIDAAPPATPVSVPVAASPTPATQVVRSPTAASGAGVATPRLLQDAQPRYPLPALRGRIEGAVEVAFEIQPDGSVRNARLVSATPEGLFDASALAVAARWRFEASGQAHRSQRTVLFRLPQ